MNKTMLWKVILIIAVLLLAVYCAYPPQEKIRLGIDLKGGAEVLFDIDTEGLSEKQKANITDSIISIVEKRIDPAGVLEKKIRPVGKTSFVLQIPEVDRNKLEDLKRRATDLGKLEWKIVEVDADLIRRAREGVVPPGYIKYDYKEADDGFILVKKKDEYGLTGEYLQSVSPATDERGMRAVGFTFKVEGRRRLSRCTRENIGRQMAIILNDQVHSAPVIQAQLTSGGIITQSPSGFTEKDQTDLITILNAGSLPAKLIVRSETYVGPSLGADSIRKGIRASVIALVIVLLFIAAYYLAAGLVADFALFLNMVLIIGGLGLFQATLTLPGIAGMILIVGMAVDANVLIFERIREEQGRGRVLALSIKNGYERAFRTIFDANITTFITALILYYVGTGPVQGFATTLMMGIVISMFTSVFVTRVVFNLLMSAKLLKKFRMFRLIKKPEVSFTRLFPVAAGLSLILIVAGVWMFVARGKKNLDIDFLGGTRYHLVLTEKEDIAAVRRAVAEHGIKNAEVQMMLAEAREVGATEGKEFAIRVDPREGSLSEVTKKLLGAFKDKINYTRAQFSHVEVTPLTGGVRVEARLELVGGLTKEELQKSLAAAEIPGISLVGTEVSESSGMVTGFTVTLPATDEKEIKEKLSAAIAVPEAFKGVTQIGAVVAGEMRNKAVLAVFLSWLAIIGYIWVRFHGFKYGLAAVAALIHDVLITVGLLAIADAIGATPAGRYFLFSNIKINLNMVAAILTIIGYSINDTIVVFDRIRENLAGRKFPTAKIIDRSVNQTLARTVLTSLTTFMVVTTLYIWGGQTIHGFALALMIGVLVGTYSSVFIASPILLLGRAKERP